MKTDLSKTQSLLKSAFRRSIFLFSGCWALPLVFVMRLMSPLIIIRLGTIRSDRIGHFAPDAIEQKVRIQISKNRKIHDYFWLSAWSANTQWEAMVRREFLVYDWTRFIDLWNRILPGGEKHIRPSTYTWSRDVHGICRDGAGAFSFTESEDSIAKKYLSSVGWQEGRPFVCLLVRDAAYLSKEENLMGGEGDPGKWDYHNYRDSDIKCYRAAVNWLADQGFFIFRMGKIARDPLGVDHPLVIDYAFDDQKTDLLDVWLFAHCNFCISTGTGPDAISMVYGKPNLYLNAMPLADLHSYQSSTWIPKNLFWEHDGKPLSLRDYVDSYFFSTEQYHKAGIEISDLTESELKTYVQEFYLRYNGLWVDTAEDCKLHGLFWKALEEWPRYKSRHVWRHDESRTSTIWLRSKSAGFFD